MQEIRKVSRKEKEKKGCKDSLKNKSQDTKESRKK